VIPSAPTYYLLPTTHDIILAKDDRPQTTDHLLPILPITYSLLPTPYSLLPITYSLLPTTYYLLPTTYYLLPTTYYLLPTPYYLLPRWDGMGLDG
jgi:hypothetical protein